MTNEKDGKDFEYGDKIKIDGKMTRVLFEKDGWIYYGGFGDAIKKDYYLKIQENENRKNTRRAINN